MLVRATEDTRPSMAFTKFRILSQGGIILLDEYCSNYFEYYNLGFLRNIIDISIKHDYIVNIPGPIQDMLSSRNDFFITLDKIEFYETTGLNVLADINILDVVGLRANLRLFFGDTLIIPANSIRMRLV